MKQVVIVTTGNEVLNGDILDTNTSWLCKRLTHMGGFVASAALVRDDVDAIAREIRAGLDRGASLVTTLGGLGPTADDLTLQAVAQATGHALTLQQDALAQVARKYQDLAAAGEVLHSEMTPAREKMALLPAGALPLENLVGAAPGVYLSLADAAIVSLPGVPAEMKGIFDGALQPFLVALFGVNVYIEKTALVSSGDESVLAPILHAVAQQYPAIYLKSHAQRFGPDVAFRVTLSMPAATRADAEREIDTALDSLAQELKQHGVNIISVEEHSEDQA
jgi:molybdenum cofactor synthesis domain-containing protein